MGVSQNYGYPILRKIVVGPGVTSRPCAVQNGPSNCVDWARLRTQPCVPKRALVRKLAKSGPQPTHPLLKACELYCTCV